MQFCSTNFTEPFTHRLPFPNFRHREGRPRLLQLRGHDADDLDARALLQRHGVPEGPVQELVVHDRVHQRRQHRHLRRPAQELQHHEH